MTLKTPKGGVGGSNNIALMISKTGYDQFQDTGNIRGKF